jgi:hypothetical protein
MSTPRSTQLVPNNNPAEVPLKRRKNVDPAQLIWLHALEDGHDLLKRDPEYDGSCPCFELSEPGLRVVGHCWRTRYEGCSCRFAGVHVWGPAWAAKRVKVLLDELGWCGWTLVREGAQP